MSYSLTRTAESRSAPFLLIEFQMHENTFFRYTDTEKPKSFAGSTFEQATFTCQFPGEDGDLNDTDMTVELQGDSAPGLMMLNHPPSFVGRVRVWEGNLLDPNKETRIRFQGRIMSGKWKSSGRIEVAVSPASTELGLVGKPHMNQRSCPHALYGNRCLATRIRRTVSAVIGTDGVIRTSGYPASFISAATFARGELSWTNPTTSEVEYRTISFCNDNGGGLDLYVDYPPPGVTSFNMAMGCTRTEEACADWHNNINNFGGQPWIPLVSPHNKYTEFY